MAKTNAPYCFTLASLAPKLLIMLRADYQVCLRSIIFGKERRASISSPIKTIPLIQFGLTAILNSFAAL